MRDFWILQTKRLCRRFNYACVLSTALPQIALVSAVFFPICVIARENQIHELFLFGIYLVIVLGIFASAWILSRKSFIGTEEALIRLDSALELGGRLLSAYSGVGEFPEETTLPVDDGLRWRQKHIFSYLLFSSAAVSAALLLPVHAEEPLRANPVLPPLAMSKLEQVLEELDKSQQLDKEDIKKFSSQLEELQAKPPGEWYDQGTLEAAESLSERLEHGLNDLLSHMDALRNLIEETGKAAGNIPEDLASALKEEIDRLQDSDPGLNRELQDKLNSLAEQGKSGRKLTNEGRGNLQAELGKSKKAIKQALKNSNAHLKKWSEQEKTADPQGSGGSCSANGQGESCGEQGDGEGKGEEGSISRGPGTAPLNLKEKSPKMTSNAQEEITGPESNEIELGELEGLRSRAPEVSGDQQALPSEGGEHSKSSGGKSAFLQEFTPDEAEVLKRYFK